MSSSKFPLIIIGGGGHASVLADILLLQGRKILAVIAPNSIEESPTNLNNFKHLKKDKDILQFDKKQMSPNQWNWDDAGLTIKI